MSMTADDFISALRALEADRDPEPLAALYAGDATCGNTATTRTFTGPDGAREFWTGYRDTFDTIASDFRLVLEAEEGVALEWVSEGTLAGGEQVRYEGVTVVALADGRIARSTAHFDPRAVLGTVGA
jgi:ketosteroid isomerase-like protein